MLLDKQTVLEMISQQGNPQLVEQAEQHLPEQIDHEQHAELLQRFGLDPQRVLDQFGGGGGLTNSGPAGGAESGL